MGRSSEGRELTFAVSGLSARLGGTGILEFGAGSILLSCSPSQPGKGSQKLKIR